MSTVRLPDFIIGGAPKCATSSLHAVLHEHPAIALPQLEFGFFDADDPITHPDFFWPKRSGLLRFEYDPPGGRFFESYVANFLAYGQADFVGEHSTTYLSSQVAPSRIKETIPDVRMIFMIRDPVSRAYSQYWHDVQNGRVTSSFEATLLKRPNIVLGSTYLPGIKRYMDLFTADRVKVILFEDYATDAQRQIDGIIDYIGAARIELPEEKLWSNRTPYPRFPTAQLLVNRLRQPLIAGRYRSHLRSAPTRISTLAWEADLKLRRRMPITFAKPPMRSSTKEYLQRHLSDRNRGLSELLGRDLSEVWSGFKG